MKQKGEKHALTASVTIATQAIFPPARWLTKFYSNGLHHHQQRNQSPLFVIYSQSNHRSPWHSQGNKYLYLFLEM